MTLKPCKIVSLCLAGALTLSGAGALSFDGTNDWFECAAYSMDVSVEEVGVMAFVSPDFDSTSATTFGIIGNWDPAGCRRGMRLAWEGTVQKFRFEHARRTDLGACPPNGPHRLFCDMAQPFSAGDLIGIYGILKDGLQQCQALNYTTGNQTPGSAFAGSGVFNSPLPLLVGDDGDGNPWKGVIHQVLLLTGASNNTSLSQLPAFRKLRFVPQFTGTQGLNGGGGIVTVIDGAWNMESETASLDQVQGAELSCTAVGSPTPVGTQMQR